MSDAPCRHAKKDKSMKKSITCLRCGQKMRLIGTEKIQLGQTGWILGDLSNLLAGAMKVDIYNCTGCGKLEFFSADGNDEKLPQKKCPNCGKQHDFDYPQCPFCKFRYDM